jgi:hypothetical protein
MRPAVGVGERQQVCRTGIEGGLAGGTERPGLLDHLHAAGPGHLEGAVRRAVVDDDELVRPVGLRREGVEAVAQLLPAVLHDDGHADRHGV